MPVDFVNKLFRMLQDIEVNKDLNSAFKKSLDTSNNNNCKHMAGRNFVDLRGDGRYEFCQECLNVKILNAGAWSRSKDRSHLTLPRELEDLVPEVEDFYKKKHTGRKLNWAHHWSTGTVSTDRSINSGLFTLILISFLDLLQQQGRQVRPGGDHPPDGNPVLLE